MGAIKKKRETSVEKHKFYSKAEVGVRKARQRSKRSQNLWVKFKFKFRNIYKKPTLVKTNKRTQNDVK